MYNHTIICSGDTIFYCKGGQYENKFVPLMTNKNIKHIAVGNCFVVVVEDTNVGSILHIWNNCGNGIKCQKLNLKKSTIEIKEKIKQIVCGDYHLVYLTNNGDVFVMGCNISGQLGLSIEQQKHKGYNKEYTKEPILLMTDRDIKMISSGSCHTLILKNNGELWGFGQNELKELGESLPINVLNQQIMTDINIDSVYCGAYYSLILKKNGKLILFGNFSFEDHEKQQIFDHPLLSFESSSKVKQIVCGEYHIIILKESGEVIGFGCNYFGQLGGKLTRAMVYPLLLTSNDAKTISCNANTSIIYLNNGELLGFGDDFQKDHKWEEIVKPKLLIKDDNINFLDNALVERNWSCENHKTSPESFKEIVLLFVLHLKRNQLKTGLKIPKFVLFEIIKKAYTNFNL